MIFSCANCHFVFQRTGECEQCPDCGKFTVKEATELEKEEFKKRQMSKEQMDEDAD